MIYEKEIPAYAMVPAKEIEERVITPVTKGAIFTPLQVTNITEKPKTIITIEEDILVPDTKPDLREILLIDGNARLASREADQVPRNEDYVNVSGEVELQTLYIPENEQLGGPVIAVQARVPFKEQWHTGLSQGSALTMDLSVEKIDYMVINERKYRVKISLALSARECTDSKINVFEGITGEELLMLKEKKVITNVALRKKDTVSISENLEIEEDLPLENILKQDICVVENYKQVTGEKIVVNGFVYVNLLYTVACEEDHMRTDCIRQAREKVEFTQFIPLSQDAGFSGSNVTFDGSGLKVKLVNDEEAGYVFRLEGDVLTYVVLYRNVEKDIMVDGYHREKDFICDFALEKCRSLVGTAAGEASVREIITPDQSYGEIDKILYAMADSLSAQSWSEQGRVVTEGTLVARMICQGKDSADTKPRLFSLRQEVPFRVISTALQAAGDEIISDKIHVKDIWAEKINGKQIEFNASVAVNAEIMKEVPFKILVNPAFEEAQRRQRRAPMTVYVAGKGESLWSIAKKFKTSAQTISQLNQLEDGELTEGRKLLILR